MKFCFVLVFFVVLALTEGSRYAQRATGKYERTPWRLRKADSSSRIVGGTPGSIFFLNKFISNR